jgi:hypothetical protein
MIKKKKSKKKKLPLREHLGKIVKATPAERSEGSVATAPLTPQARWEGHATRSTR